MIEDQEKRFVGGREQVEDEAVERRARVRDALPVHAVADVHQDAEADRQPIPRHESHRLFSAVFMNDEIVAFEIGDQSAVAVRDRGGHLDELDLGAVRLGAKDRRDEPGREQHRCGGGKSAARAK